MLRKIILAIISSLLVILAFPKFNLDFLVWVSFVPLFFALENTNIKQRFLIGYVFGVFMFFGLLYWLFNVSMLGAIVLIFFLAIYPAIGCLYKIRDSAIIVFIIPSMWVISEFLRAHIFSGFPWTLLGHCLYKNIVVIQIADITGVYGLSFIVIMINIVFFSILRSFRNKRYHVFVCVLFCMITLFYGFSFMQVKLEKEPVDIALIQGNIAQEKKWDAQNYEVEILEQYMSLSELAVKKGSDLIIWPETSVPGLYSEDASIKYIIDQFIKRMKKDFLIGSVRYNEGNYYNSAYFVSSNAQIEQIYDKMHLVPFGEYIPFENKLPWIRSAIDKPVGDMLPGKEYKIFYFTGRAERKTSEGLIREIRFLKFGVLICFEDIFPDISRGAVKLGAEFLVNMTNDAWFGDTNAAYEHVQSSVFRAVENRVSVVRSANTGISCFIDPRGKITDILKVKGKETFVEGICQGEIYKPIRQSFYTKFGDVFVWFCLIMCVGLIILDKKQIQVDSGILKKYNF
jgi:apolipoprotein N-acyltransferase